MPPASDRKPVPSARGGRAPFALLAALTLAVAAALAWTPGLDAPFLLDDAASIGDNPTIRRLWPPAWLNPPGAIGETVGGRPVLNFSFALNHALTGDGARGYRLGNLLIHVLAALTLAALVRRTLRLAGHPDRAGLVALAVALLWLLHPLQTAAVTYVVQRAESLCGLFFLLTLYAFLRGAAPHTPDGENPSSRRWLALSVAACALGMGTKEVMASAPLVVFLCDRAFVAGSVAAAWRARRHYYLALAATWLVLGFLVLTNARRGGSAGFGTEIDAWSYALTQCQALLLYVKLAFWPAGQVFDYGTATAGSLGEVAVHAVIVILALALTIWALVKKPVVGTLAAAFFLILAPSSSLVPVATQTMAEHRVYLPLAALVILTVLAVRTAARRLPHWLPLALAALALVALAAATRARNTVYQTELSLWQDTVAKRPDNPRAHHNLGLALFNADRADEAEAEFRRALELQPNHAFARFQLGVLHLTHRRWAEAATELQLALEADPHFTAARVNLGQALTQLGRPDEAAAQYRAALADDPTAQDARTNLAALLVTRGRAAEGAALLREAIAAAPDLAEAHYHLGLALGRGPEAEAAFRDALRLKPDLVAARLALGNVLAARGDLRGADEAYRETLRQDPSLAEAHYARGNLFARQQRFDDALAAYQEALRLEPAHIQARNNLANAQLVTGRLDAAIANYEAVLRVRPDDEAVRRNLELAREMKSAGPGAR